MLVIPQHNRMYCVQHIDLLKYIKLRQLQQICIIFAVEYTIKMRKRRKIRDGAL